MLLRKVAFWMLAASTISLVACDKDNDTTPVSTYENGILIINEGPFGGSGGISHYDRSSKRVITDIFSDANQGAKAGSVVQSCYLHNNKMYVLVNAANKVWVVNPTDFKVVDSVKNITLPRYFLPIDDKKGYISNWKTGLDVIDLTTNKVIKSIATGAGSEQMLRNGSTVWVLNGNGLKVDSTIAIVDIASEKVVRTLKAAIGPKSIVAANGSIWVLCESSYLLPNVSGRLIEYKNETIVNSYEVPAFAKSLVASADGKQLFFIAGAAIYSKDATNTAAAPSIFATRANNARLMSPYGLGIDSKDGRLLCSDAKNYAVNSKVYFFDIQRKIALDSIEAGVASNSFWFGN
jgi:hypothetical protein